MTRTMTAIIEATLLLLQLCFHGGAVLAQVEYGVDISFPIHHANVSVNYAWLPHNLDPTLEVPPEYEGMPVQPLGNMQAKHDEYMQGCVDHYGKAGRRCVTEEEARIAMSLRQPASMRNYTKYGFAKIRAPDRVFRLLQEFYDANKHRASEERWPVGNIYTNHWKSPTSILSVEDETLEGGGAVLKQHIWNAARSTMQAWTGYRQAECSLYGIRVYHEGSMLATHVDRLPLVSSAIINVDQDVDEPWPLEVIGHDGKAHNVTMVPGDLVLYESHSILHGRPFPLKGRYMANVFIHFEPTGPMNGVMEYDGEFPPYVIRGSPQEEVWRRENPGGHNLLSNFQHRIQKGSTELHVYSLDGDLAGVKEILSTQLGMVNARDSNGWLPIHEAARGGDTEIVELLLDHGADVHARTGNSDLGDTPLDIALHEHGHDHPVVGTLQKWIAEIRRNASEETGCTESNQDACRGNDIKREIDPEPEL